MEESTCARGVPLERLRHNAYHPISSALRRQRIYGKLVYQVNVRESPLVRQGILLRSSQCAWHGGSGLVVTHCE